MKQFGCFQLDTSNEVPPTMLATYTQHCVLG
jgi:hypothetical protein